MFLNLTPTPKIAPKDQKHNPKWSKKVQKRPKMWPKDLCLSMHTDEVLHWGFIFAPKEVKFCMSHPCPWGNEAIMLLSSEPNSFVPLFAFLLKKWGKNWHFSQKFQKRWKIKKWKKLFLWSSTVFYCVCHFKNHNGDIKGPFRCPRNPILGQNSQFSPLFG